MGATIQFRRSRGLHARQTSQRMRLSLHCKQKCLKILKKKGGGGGPHTTDALALTFVAKRTPHRNQFLPPGKKVGRGREEVEMLQEVAG